MTEGGGGMTADHLKNLDKHIRRIRDPFGAGFPAIREIFLKCAEKNETTVLDLVRQYAGWKWSKCAVPRRGC